MNDEETRVLAIIDENTVIALPADLATKYELSGDAKVKAAAILSGTDADVSGQCGDCIPIKLPPRRPAYISRGSW